MSEDVLKREHAHGGGVPRGGRGAACAWKVWAGSKSPCPDRIRFIRVNYYPAECSQAAESVWRIHQPQRREVPQRSLGDDLCTAICPNPRAPRGFPKRTGARTFLSARSRPSRAKPSNPLRTRMSALRLVAAPSRLCGESRSDRDFGCGSAASGSSVVSLLRSLSSFPAKRGSDSSPRPSPRSRRRG